MSSKLMKTRNLLAENDLYQLFEFTFLRQLVVNVREVITHRSQMLVFGRYFGHICAATCSREKPQLPLPAQILQISLNAKTRVQVCAPICTGELAV